MASLQTQMLFPTNLVGAPGPLPRGAKQIETLSAEGTTLRGVHIAARGSAGDGTLVLGFGGNAWNGSDVAAFLHELYPQADVVAFHYRGYKPSLGKPSAEALIADAPLVHDFAVRLVKPRRVIAAGFSIGSGVAASLAARRELDGLILVTPFDSLGEVAAGHYRWLPVRLLFRHRLEPARDLAGAAVPVAIISGERDTLIPPARTDALRAALAHPVFDRTIAGAGHNDIYQHPVFETAMRDAMARILAVPS